ncbi:uncharacterized protein RAG0_01124 [Rhynchosporium agropyri]|uniref:Uncharacterized protein n=1 Tax=Rhynchosporium agropyri TaxID=914238 RepID=A0A1E1JVJ0_9HELO|nr:uncharacterized protein RAG0_01124 [Rhynchosporium agropyri]
MQNLIWVKAGTEIPQILCKDFQGSFTAFLYTDDIRRALQLQHTAIGSVRHGLREDHIKSILERLMVARDLNGTEERTEMKLRGNRESTNREQNRMSWFEDLKLVFDFLKTLVKEDWLEASLVSIGWSLFLRSETVSEILTFLNELHDFTRERCIMTIRRPLESRTS